MAGLSDYIYNQRTADLGHTALALHALRQAARQLSRPPSHYHLGGGVLVTRLVTRWLLHAHLRLDGLLPCAGLAEFRNERRDLLAGKTEPLDAPGDL